MKPSLKVLIALSVGLLMISCATQAPAPKAEGPVPPSVSPEPSYFLNSSEYKLLLNPEMFGDYKQGFAQYWDIIKTVAADQGIEIIKSEKPLKLGHKEVSFFDTKDLELRQNNFLLRQKVKYKGEHKNPGVEYGVKYRQTNPEKTMALDLSMAEGYTPKYDRIELESDIVYYSVKNGDHETTYAVSNSIQLENQPEMKLAEFIKIYPVLGNLGIDPESKLNLVADMAADEWMVKPGKLDFGGGLHGRMDMTVWILQTEMGEIRIPEFSFDHDFLPNAHWDAAAMEKCTGFIEELYKYQPEWVVPGTLKAAALFKFK
ncbi:MAG: hypothetical protein U9Q77_10355 [Candidatus Marinimicrobia bacterium]|nr:hypothetical protein [Candidatus Neomarinimicrobiota bacterium]